jgi:hypothetical protein
MIYCTTIKIPFKNISKKHSINNPNKKNNEQTFENCFEFNFHNLYSLKREKRTTKKRLVSYKLHSIKSFLHIYVRSTIVV